MPSEDKNQEEEIKENEHEEQNVVQNVYLDFYKEEYGILKSLKANKSTVELSTKPNMAFDKQGLMHNGYLYSSACYSALLAINDPNAVVLGSDVKYLAPIEAGNNIIFEASVAQKEAKKKEVTVNGFLFDIKVFYGVFYVAIFDKHILRLKLSEK